MARRVAELPGPAVEAFQEHPVRALASGRVRFPWVFCETNGQPLNRIRLRETLADGKFDHDLTALREPHRPSLLSPAILEGRRRLWQDLDELINRIESNP